MKIIHRFFSKTFVHLIKNSMKKIYKSKIGLEIIIPILIILAFGFKNIISEPKVAPIILLILVLAFITFLLTSIKYTIENQNLNIKAGFLINQNINIMNIESIKKSKNILSSPAASLDRIEIIENNKNSILISPKNKIEFIEELKKINPQIDVKL